MMVFLYVRWAYVCIMMVSKNPNTAKNTAVLLPIEKMDVNVLIPVLTPNMEEQSIFSKRIIQDYLTYRQGIVHSGNQSTTNEPSVERSNKREKIDYKLEDGRHRSSKMWYCRLYAIMMLQHLDAWEMPTRVNTIFTFSRIANT